MTQKALTGILLDEQVELSLLEISEACSTSTEWIIKLVDEGVLEPLDRQQSQWRFPGGSLQKAHAAMRLQKDLNINLAGIALVLELVEEIESLRQRLRRFAADDDTGW